MPVPFIRPLILMYRFCSLQVGIIEIDSDDNTDYSFRIQVMGRLYHLRANSRTSCHDWIITLNRVKEARMQQGNVKQNGKSTSHVEDGTPRVVVVSNRERTRAVDEEDQWDQLIRVDPHHTTLEMDVDPVTGESMYAHNKRLSSIGTVVAARWTNHQSSLQRLGTKVSKWARSVKQYSCTTADGTTETPAHAASSVGGGVQLDKYPINVRSSPHYRIISTSNRDALSRPSNNCPSPRTSP